MEVRAVQFGMDREQRIDAMWRRFRRAMARQGLETPTRLECVACKNQRRLIMFHSIRKGRPKGWRFRSALEAGDLGMHKYVPAASPEPTDAAPGSCEKLNVLAERILSGLELWHPNDETVLARINNA